MREIIFRGKSKNNNEWIYGFYSPLIWYPSFKQTPSIKTFKGVDMEINPETLGQYTGIKDKNGTKIFEGDILCMTFKDEWANNEERKVYYFIKFNDGMFATFYYDFLDEVEEDRLCEALIEVDKLEVVGNIYDNPQLL